MEIRRIFFNETPYLTKIEIIEIDFKLQEIDLSLFPILFRNRLYCYSNEVSEDRNSTYRPFSISNQDIENKTFSENY
jgi:hypothetical protein